MGLRDELKHVPVWVWVAVPVVAIIIVVIHGRSTSASTTAATTALTSGVTASPLTSGNGTQTPAPGTPDAFPSQYNPPASTAAPASTQSGLTFKDWFNLGTGWQNPSNNGFNGNATDTLTGGRDWAETLAQFQSSDPAFQAWQKAWLGGAGAPNPGDVNAGHQLYLQGMQFLTDPALASQVVPGQGQIAQYNQTYPAAPAATPSAGGGGYVMHPNASSTGSMSDLLGLVGSGAPSIYGLN